MGELSTAEIEECVDAVLRLVIDPELGQNIVDLGLVYGVAAGEDGLVHITMTTTTKGCPATDYLKTAARTAALNVPDVVDAEVELTYDPPWKPQMMTRDLWPRFGIQEQETW
ncbi:MAG TPA: metal-sulfur cluster assembly factor [Devosiaceae bacterium]